MKAWMLLVASLLGAVGEQVAAQTPSSKVFVRYTKPLRRATVDLATGTVTRGPVVHQRSATTISDFPNVDLGGFIGGDTGGGFCEWFDAGVKGFHGNASDLMNNFIMGYCCATLAVESGGVGGTTNLGFYEGYVTGGGTPTTAVAVLTLSGLPGNTANSSPFVMGGGTACFLINITFAALVPFADGPIGYSWHFLDFDITGTIASTIPFMSCVSSCSGVGPDGLGMVDFIDEYCPPGFLLTTFTFGTTQFGSYFTSMSMDVREVSDCAGTISTYNSTSPPNTDVLSGSLPMIGTTWVAEVSHGANTATASTLVVRGAAIPGNGAPTPYGRLLVTGPFIGNFPGTPDAIVPISATQRNFNILIPLSFSACCFDFFGQALTLGSIRLSNAVHGFIGTF